MHFILSLNSKNAYSRKSPSMNTVTRIGIALIFVFGLLANVANAGQPKKKDLEARIAYLEEALRERDSFPSIPVLPPSFSPMCIIGTASICHRRDGTVVPICAGDINPCWDAEPPPDICPEACEKQGDIVVVDYAIDPCDAWNQFSFVCMTPSEYAASRSNITCPASFVLHYNSLKNGWACELSFENGHLSRSVYEALLFESTRTNFLYNEIVNKPQ